MAQSSSPTRPASRPERLGRYRLLEKLHDGALGPLWAARSTEGIDRGKPFLVRRIAIDPAWASDTLAALLDAAHAAMRLEHVEIVPVLDVAQSETELGVVHAAVEGETLRTLLWRAGIKRSPIPPSIALRIVLDVISAATHLHEQRTDRSPTTAGLGPDQIIVSASGHAKLLDPIVCGVACGVAPWTKEPKWASYRARETLRHDVACDERADVFSVGVLLWEMLRNRPLFGGARFEAVERSIVQGSVSRVDSLRPAGGETINKKLGDVVARSLEREPIARQKSLAELEAALRDTADGIAKPDGVAAFVERASAEALERQRELFEGTAEPAEDAAASAGDESARAGSAPAGAAEPGPAKGEAEPGAPPSAEGVPDFSELFSADDSKSIALAKASTAEAAHEPQEAGPKAGSKPPATPPPAAEAASRPPTRKVDVKATEADQREAAAAAAEASASAEQVQPGDGVIKEPTVATAVAPPLERGGGRALVLVLAAVAVIVVAWVWNPFGQSFPPAPTSAVPTATAEPPTAAATATATTEPTVLPTSSAAPASAPSTSGSEPEAEAPTASATVSASASATPKKKSGGGRYMPGTL